MKVDPLASMRCWAVTVELGGREYEIPALPAADWWPIVSVGDLAKILDLIPNTPDLDEMLLDGRLTGDDLSDTLMDVVEEIAGRSMHATLVLGYATAANWTGINGQLAATGFRWDVMPLGAALDAVHSIIVNGLEEKNQKKFLALLENEALTTPRSRRREPDREKIRAEFESFAGPMPTAGALSTGEPSGSARPRTRRRPRPLPQGDPSPEPTPLPGPPAGSDPPASS